MKMLGVYAVEVRRMSRTELATAFSYIEPNILLDSLLMEARRERTENVGVVEFEKWMNREEVLDETSRHGYQLASSECFFSFGAQHPDWDKTYLIESWVRIMDPRGVSNPYLLRGEDKRPPQLRLGLEGRNGPMWRYLVVEAEKNKASVP